MALPPASERRRLYIERVSGAFVGLAVAGCGGGRDAPATTAVGVTPAPVAGPAPVAAPTPVVGPAPVPVPTPVAPPPPGPVAAPAPTTPSGLAKMVFEGDSRSAFDGEWSYLVQPMLTGSAFQVVATSGERFPDMIQAYAQRLGAAYDPGVTSNIAVIFAGTNTNGYVAEDTSGAGKYGELKQVIAAATATGYRKIVVCTEICCKMPGEFDGVLKPYNALIRAGFANGDLKVSAIVDFEANPHFDETADAFDTTYFSDGLNPTATGHTLLATLAKPVLQRVIDGPPLT